MRGGKNASSAAYTQNKCYHDDCGSIGDSKSAHVCPKRCRSRREPSTLRYPRPTASSRMTWQIRSGPALGALWVVPQPLHRCSYWSLMARSRWFSATIALFGTNVGTFSIGNRSTIIVVAFILSLDNAGCAPLPPHKKSPLSCR